MKTTSPVPVFVFFLPKDFEAKVEGKKKMEVLNALNFDGSLLFKKIYKRSREPRGNLILFKSRTLPEAVQQTMI